MIIEYKSKRVRFDDVQVGHTFTQNGDSCMYIKISIHADTKGFRPNVVCLDSGKAYSFEGAIPVELTPCKVVEL